MNFEDAVYNDKVFYLNNYDKELAELELERVIEYKVNEITFRLINPKADGKCGYYLMHIVGNVLNSRIWTLEQYKKDFRMMNTYQMNEYDAATFLKHYGANLLCITKQNAPKVSLFIDKPKPWVILYNDQSHWKLLTYQSEKGKSQAVYCPIFKTELVRKIFNVNIDELKSTILETPTLDTTRTPLNAMPPPEILRIRDDKLTKSLFDVLEDNILFKTGQLTDLEIMNIIYRHTLIKRGNNDPNDQTSEQLRSFIDNKFNIMLGSTHHDTKTTTMLIEWFKHKQPTIDALCVALDCFRFITVDEKSKSFSESKYTCSSSDVLCILMTTYNELIVNRAFENRGDVSGNYVRIFHKPSEVRSFITRHNLTQKRRKPSGSSRKPSGTHADERKNSSSASRRKQAIEKDAEFAKELQKQEFMYGLRKQAQDAHKDVERLKNDETEWMKLHWKQNNIPRRRVSAARKSVSRRNKTLGEIQDEKKREEVKTKYESELKKIDEEKQMKAKQEEADQAFAQDLQDEYVLDDAAEYRRLRKIRIDKNKGVHEKTPTKIKIAEAAALSRKGFPSGK